MLTQSFPEKAWRRGFMHKMHLFLWIHKSLVPKCKLLIRATLLNHPTSVTFENVCYMNKKNHVISKNTLFSYMQFFSFSCNLQVVQEYERAVIFRLGRLMQGGAKGPGKLIQLTFHSLVYIYAEIPIYTMMQ